MKATVLLLSLSLAACAHGGAGNEAHDEPDDAGLYKAMSIGKVITLNELQPEIDKDLSVRLYQVPTMDQDCFVETHGICQYEYYVAVSTFDEYPQVNVYKLATKGELAEITWVSDDRVDYVELDVTLNRYTSEALRNNKALDSAATRIRLKLSPTAMEEVVR